MYLQMHLKHQIKPLIWYPIVYIFVSVFPAINRYVDINTVFVYNYLYMHISICMSGFFDKVLWCIERYIPFGPSGVIWATWAQQ